MLESGLLATDKCPAETTYRELATKEQMPSDPCNVHGDARTRIVRDLPDAGVPRAALAVDTAQVKAVAVQGPTLLADSDPYNAVRSTARPPAPLDEAKLAIMPVPPKKVPEEEQILRAQPVTPEDRDPTEIRRAEPVLRAQPVDPRAAMQGQGARVPPARMRPRPQPVPEEEESGD